MKQLWHNSFFRKISVFFPVLLLIFLNPVKTQNQINQSYMMFSDACPAGYTDASSITPHAFTTGFYKVSANFAANCNAGDRVMVTITSGDIYVPVVTVICAVKTSTTGFYPFKISEPDCISTLNSGSPLPACSLSPTGYNFAEVSATNFDAFNGFGTTYVSCRHCYERVKLCQWNP